MNDEVATCRGCGQVLDGKPYYMGGRAYDPVTRKEAKANHYGGFVCSESCDYRAALSLEQTMPGHGGKKDWGTHFPSKSVGAGTNDPADALRDWRADMEEMVMDYLGYMAVLAFLAFPKVIGEQLGRIQAHARHSYNVEAEKLRGELTPTLDGEPDWSTLKGGAL